MTIWIDERVLEAMATAGRALQPLEAGGILLGWRDAETKIVSDLLGPGPHALHGRHALVPDHRWQTERIRTAFRDSKGDLDYLGDWHTHPDGLAAMSELDRKTLNRIGKRVRGALMVIAAGGAADWTYGGWAHTRSRMLGAGSCVKEDLHAFRAPEAWPRIAGDRGLCWP